MPRGSRRNNLPTQQEPFLDKSSAGEILKQMMPLFDIGKDETTPAIYQDTETLEKVIKQYFMVCADNGLRPGVIGLLSAIGITYREYQAECNGVTNKISRKNLSLVKKARLAIESYIEQTAACGVLNPVLGIFWQKNYTGLRDSQDITLTPKQDIQATKTLEQIEQDIPID